MSNTQNSDIVIPPLNFSNVDDFDGSTAFDDPPKLEEEYQSESNNQRDDHVIKKASEFNHNIENGDHLKENTASAEEEKETNEFSEAVANFSKSYDTIKSLNLEGENADSLGSNEENVEKPGQIKFTLSGVVEDETSTDVNKSDDEDLAEFKTIARKSFTKILTSPPAEISTGGFGKRSSLQIDDIKLNYEDNNDDEIINYHEPIDEETDEVEDKRGESTKKEDTKEEENVQSTLTSESQDRKPFIKIKRVILILIIFSKGYI
jgi:hypothetical protein